jgi:hypothetical protein
VIGLIDNGFFGGIELCWPLKGQAIEGGFRNLRELLKLMRLSSLIFAMLVISVCANAGAEETLHIALKRHCFRCHGDGKVKGKVNLVRTLAAKPHGLASDPDLIGNMIDALASGEMPPEDEKQPTKAERARWIAQLKAILKEHLAKHPVPTRVPIRRMNRFEYNNAVKDLFKLERDPFALPERTVRDIGGYFKPATGKMPGTVVVGNRAMGKSQFIGTGNTLPGVAAFPRDNRAEHGFNNRGDHLSLSPVLMKSFFELSHSIVNSPEFPIHSRSWKTMFVAPDGLSPKQLRAEGKQRLRMFLRRAFRKDVTDEIVSRYHGHFLRQLDERRTFTESIKAAVSAAMVSPRFLYIYSGSGQNNTTRTPTSFELASRLSFLLWNSIPDPALLDLASQGKLSDPKILGEQADRMMNDRRLKNFCDSFALQWLQLDMMVAAVPDNKRFREYYFGGANGMIYMVGMHMMIEPLLLFETVLIEDRPITELIDPNFTYQSEMLKRWYHRDKGKGRAEVVGIRFKRVPIEDRRWGGVITNAAVMTMTSSPLRTKPITRGAWLVSTIFNDPPDPPPAEVPKINSGDETLEKEGLTLRDKLKQHVTRPDCTACHKKIDPLGFALENYDPMGRWRDTYRTGLPIDSSGKLFNKHAFQDVIGFKDAILAEKDRFARAFAGHLLSYALGRKLDVVDRSSLDRIVANSAKNGYRFRTMIREVVLSSSFTNITPIGAEKR